MIPSSASNPRRGCSVRGCARCRRLLCYRGAAAGRCSGDGARGITGWLGGAVFAAHLAWQVKSIDPGNGQLALTLFKSNRDAGLLLFAGLVVDAVLRAS